MTTPRMSKHIAVVAALTAALGICAPTPAVAAPHDAAYDAAAEKIAAGTERSLIEQEAHRVVIDSGHALSIVDPDDVETSIEALSALPAAYTAPYTSVKDQSSFPVCWAFTTIGALESSWMAVNGIAGERSDAIDLSEAQLIYTTFNGETVDGTLSGALTGASDNDCFTPTYGSYGFFNGGSMEAASYAMFARRGVVYESDNPTFVSYNTEELPSLAETMATRAAASWRLNRIAIDYVCKMPDLAPTVSIDDTTIDREWSASSLQKMKEAIYTTGGIVAGIYFDPVDQPRYCHNAPDYEPDPNTYQLYPENIWVYDADVAEAYPGVGGAASNHALVYVGWDDAYSRWNFATPLIDDEGNPRPYDPEIAEVARWEDGQDYIVPIGDGAWVAKNSWGGDYTYDDGSTVTVGDDGMFHVSYYEKTVDEVIAIVPFAADEQPVDETVHQYDGACDLLLYSEDDADLAGANVFTAEQDERITSVGVVVDPEAEVEVTVYTDLADPTEPESGVLAATVSTSFEERGSYTIDLPNDPDVDAGEAFSVVVRSTYPDDEGDPTRSGIVREHRVEELGTRLSEVYYQPGESFIKREEGDAPGIWVDVADLPGTEEQGLGNVRVKAFAEPVEDASEDEGGDTDSPGEDAGDSSNPEGGNRPADGEPTGGANGSIANQETSPVTGELAATGDAQPVTFVAFAACSAAALFGAAALRLRSKRNNGGE